MRVSRSSGQSSSACSGTSESAVVPEIPPGDAQVGLPHRLGCHWHGRGYDDPRRTSGRTRHNPGGRTGVMSGMQLRGSVGMPAVCPYRDHRRAVAPTRPAPCPWERLRPIRKNRPSSSNATPNGTSRLRETQANVGCAPCDTPSRSTVGAVGVAAECERARWARVPRSTLPLATSAPRHLSCGGTSGSRGRKGNPHVVDLGTHRHRLDRHRGRRIRRP
jgi:hypothetical protein